VDINLNKDVLMVPRNHKQMVADMLRDAADQIEALSDKPFKFETDMILKQTFTAQKFLDDMSEEDQ